MEIKKPNLSFSGNLIINGLEIKNVPFEIIFPETQDKKPVIKANLDKINIPLYAFPFKFGLESTVLDSTGNLRYIISASKIYNLGIKSGCDISGNKNTILTGEPVNLKIKEFFKKKVIKKKNLEHFIFG